MIHIHRLQSAKDFRTLFRFGRRRESRLFRTTVLPNNLLFCRFAFIAAKTVDKRAVVRNRLRRRAREWIRIHLLPPPQSVDIALFFKKDSKQASKKEFYEDLKSLFGQHAEK